MEEADRLAARLAIVDQGRIVAEGSPGRAQARAARRRGPRRARRGPNGSARSALDRVDGVREIVLDGQSLHARVDDGARAVPGRAGRARRAACPCASVTVARPSLDDVYLRHAGRTFEEAAR